MLASNEKAAKSNRTIYRSPEWKRRDCRIGYVFPRARDWQNGELVGKLRERELAQGCIQKCIWLPGKRSMEQRRKPLFLRDLGEGRPTFLPIS